MKKSVLSMIAAVAFAVPALAEDAVPAAPSSAQPSAALGEGSAEASALDRVVCKKMAPMTGTRLGARTICRTGRQWRDLMQSSQEDVAHRQLITGNFGHNN